MHGRFRVIALVLLASLSSTASANPRDSIPVTQAADPRVPAPRVGPHIAGATAGIRLASVRADTSVVALQRRSRDVSKPVAIMIVGGAAIILGSVVDGDAGELIVLGGVVALLYGLYQYLK